jgi:hypothetical protein
MPALDQAAINLDTVHRARPKQPPIIITPIAPAEHFVAADQTLQFSTRRDSAPVLAASFILAPLARLGRVNAEQPDCLCSDSNRVTVEDACRSTELDCPSVQRNG